MKSPRNARDRIPSVEDFKLKEQQRAFHDAYVDGETKGNAHASALAVGYSESVARVKSFAWVPAVGTTVESGRKLSPLPQAIFWTLYRRNMIREEAQARADEHAIAQGAKRHIITREYVEGTLREIVERCMARTEKIVDAWNRDLGFEIAKRTIDEAGSMLKADADRAKLAAMLSLAFREFASKYHVFKPTQAKEAVKLLGIEIGMFQRIIKKTPETPIDEMSPDQLAKEEQRLKDEFAALTAAQRAKGNGHGRPKAN